MELPPIFIPSKGRWNSQRVTWEALFQENIPFTIVVEPQELEDYRNSITIKENITGHTHLAKIVALPLDDQGISFSRNHIVFTLAPKASWFWMIDDDILSFHAIKKGDHKVAKVPFKTALRIANAADAIRIEPKTCIIGMEYSQFLHRGPLKKTPYTLNSYANVCVLMNRSMFPRNSSGILYRFPIREDYDFCMQIISHGGSVFRYQCVGFAAPMMGSRKGGMTPFYVQKTDLIRKCNSQMIQFWGSSICQEVFKGKFAQERFDLKVHWQRLDEISRKAIADGTTYMELMKQPIGWCFPQPLCEGCTL